MKVSALGDVFLSPIPTVQYQRVAGDKPGRIAGRIKHHMRDFRGAANPV